MEKFSAQQAANALRHVIAYYEQSHGGEDTIIKMAKYGLYILEYIANYIGIIKAAIRLQQRDPNLAAIFREFPMTDIMDIRERRERGELHGEKTEWQTQSSL